MRLYSIYWFSVFHISKLTNIYSYSMNAPLFYILFLSCLLIIVHFMLRNGQTGHTWHLVVDHMSRLVRKPAFCICENKDADQLSDDREADQHLYFCYIDSTSLYFLNPKFQASRRFCDCTARFVSDLVGNPEDRFFSARLILCW